MTDIVKRLRDGSELGMSVFELQAERFEAAAEIEKLRAELNTAKALLREALITLRTLDTWDEGDNVHHLIKRIRAALHSNQNPSHDAQGQPSHE